MPPDPPFEPPRSRNAQLSVIALAVVAVIAGLVVWAINASDDDPPRSSSPKPDAPVFAPNAPTSGEPAPDFDLKTLDGERVSLSALRGQPVVVNFWASWCNPCREEFPLLRKALRGHSRDDLVIVGIVFNDITSDARAFAKREHADWLLALDEDRDVARAYGVRAIPQTFFIDRDGTIRSRVFGITTAPELEHELDRIIPPT